MQRPNAIELPFKVAYDLLNLYKSATHHNRVGNCALGHNPDRVLADLNERSKVMIDPDFLASLLYHAEQLAAEKGPVKIVTEPSPTNFYQIMDSLLMTAPHFYRVNPRTKEISLMNFTRKGAKKEAEERRLELAKKLDKEIAARQHQQVMLALLEKVQGAPEQVGDINNGSDGQAD